MEPYDCHEGTGCLYRDIESGTGELEAYAGSTAPDEVRHSNNSQLRYTIEVVSRSQDNIYLVATGELAVGVATEHIDPVWGFDSVYAHELESVGGTQCGSDHCGTYSLTVTSHSYILH